MDVIAGYDLRIPKKKGEKYVFAPLPFLNALVD